jgi:hypothetical protein
MKAATDKTTGETSMQEVVLMRDEGNGLTRPWKGWRRSSRCGQTALLPRVTQASYPMAPPPAW